MDKKLADPICRLCREKNAIRNSHVTPAAVARYLIDTSVTGNIRMMSNINKPLEDSVKAPLFCTDCEGLMSRDETYFANRIFYPIHKENLKEINYNYQLGRFCALQSFRTQAYFEYESGGLDSFNNHLDKIIRNGFEFLREFVLTGRRTQDNFPHFIIPLDVTNPIGSRLSEIPNHLNHYLIRAIDINTITDQQNSYCIFTKLCRIAILTFFSPKRPTGFEKSRIFGWGQLLQSSTIESKWFFQYLIDQATALDDFHRQLSPNQKMKVQNLFVQKKDKIKNSETHRAFNADIDLKKGLL
jgi:hypothetical protein